MQTIHHTSANIRSSRLPASVQAQAIVQVHAAGTGYQPPPGTPPRQAAVLEDSLDQGVADAARVALMFVTGALGIGLALSFLIPRIEPPPRPTDDAGRTIELLESLEGMEPMEPSRDVVLGREPGTV